MLGITTGSAVANAAASIRPTQPETLPSAASATCAENGDDRYRRVFEQSRFAHITGVPRRLDIDKKFHPIPPERVVVLRPRSLCDDLTPERRSAVERVEAICRARVSLRPEKLAIVLRMAETMSGYYERPRLSNYWGRFGAYRENMGACTFGNGFALFHQFHPRLLQTRVQTVTALVDWWLFLLPDGIDYECFSDNRVHAIFAQVFDMPPNRHGLQIAAWALTAPVSGALAPRRPGEAFSNHAARELSRLDPAEAARLVNQAVADALDTCRSADDTQAIRDMSDSIC